MNRAELEAELNREYGAASALIAKYPKTTLGMLLFFSVVAIAEILIHHVFK